ncbi:hypothetical protein L211DRAFT_899786 [Terfezia boudieri ATCC MYA-4762]|uniref:Uncharacterized protein n=1 Tax=Terfezia boudieri ATCC MYA-4762 TaxID=1051890 RepID=A0A3N4LY17_9PEZI|nr:hypothetical protein L211DRAFT_899786 [Terfezia boudieri ATCC MYA-4762]
MPPADAPSKAEFETIHYIVTARGTLRAAKDPKRKEKKSHKHRRRHRNTRDSNEAEKPENEGIKTGLHAHMTPGPPHASTVTSNVMPVSQQHAQTAAMHITESSAASKERAAPRAITSKQGTHRTRPAGTIFPLLSWDEVWAEEKPELPGPSNFYRAEQNLPTAGPARARASATGNVQRTSLTNEINTRRKPASAESVPQVLVQLPTQFAQAFQDSGPSIDSNEGTDISCELPTRTRGDLQNEANGHGHLIAGSSSEPPVPPPHRFMPPRRQTLGPLLLSVQVEEYDEGSRENGVEYDVSGQEVDKRGNTLYRLQERRPGRSWSKPKNSVTLETLNQIESNLKNLELHVKSESVPPTSKSHTRRTESGQGPSYRSIEHGRVESLVADSTPSQGPQLRNLSGLRGNTLTTNQRIMDTDIKPLHNSLASLQTQRLPKNLPAMNSTWITPPPLHQSGPLKEPTSNNKKVISAQTTFTRDAPRFEENTSGSYPQRPSYSQVTQAYPAQAATAPDNNMPRRRPVLKYSDFDLQSSSSDEGHCQRYSPVPSFDTITFQQPSAHGELPISPNTTHQRGVMNTESRGYYHGIEINGHEGTPPVVSAGQAKPAHLTTRNNYPHVGFSSASNMSYAPPSGQGATFQKSGGGNNNTCVDSHVHVSQAAALVIPTCLPKGPALAFKGIMDLDPEVTLFNTVTGVVKSDISPKVALGNSTSAQRMLRIWNRKTSDDVEMKRMCEAEMRRLQRE